MPAYGNALNPSETTALVKFLVSLRKDNLPSAFDASRKMVQATEPSGQPIQPTTPATPTGKF